MVPGSLNSTLARQSGYGFWGLLVSLVMDKVALRQRDLICNLEVLLDPEFCLSSYGPDLSGCTYYILAWTEIPFSQSFMP